MIYSILAKPVHLPISFDRPATRAVTEVAPGAAASRDANRQQPLAYVYRGEVLENALDRSYRRSSNLQISPENRRAIHTYQKVAGEQPVVGKILDGFI